MNTENKMGENKDLAIGLSAVIVIIVIIVGVVIWAIGPGETKSVEQNKSTETQKDSSYMDRFMEKENRVLDLAKDYKGKGNSGLTLTEAIAMSVLAAYPGEDILNNPSTGLEWSALPTSGNPDTDKSWDVKFYLKTYRGTVNYEWTVDLETNSMYAKNENGKNILDTLNG